MSGTTPEKFSWPNRGVPVFCDPDTDLVAVPDSTMDSWYVKGHFEVEGKQIGFMWHQHATGPADARSCFGEIVVMEGTENLFFSAMIDEPVGGEFGVSEKEVNVWSRYGALTGNREQMQLAVSFDRGGLDLVVTPRREVLYNGTTGYLDLTGGSYQFAFPNMAVQGTVTVDGRTYQVPAGTTAWFDKQWSLTFASDSFSQVPGKQLPSWLWVGTPINDEGTAFISLWDIFAGGVRRTFATVLDENGLQYNVEGQVEYDGIWTHEGTGFRYPRTAHVSVPAIDLTLSFEALIDDPVYDHGQGAISGAMSLATKTGTYRGAPVNGHYILEMIGDLCGE